MTTQDMIREYKRKGGKVTVCPTKYNNDSKNVRPKATKKVVRHIKTIYDGKSGKALVRCKYNQRKGK